jgi:UDP-2,3-diacylglucosamine hydrolase
VRQPEWQREFLAKPLQERVAIAQALRTRSEDRKRGGGAYADVDPAEAAAWLAAADAPVLVHGHTHRPGEQPVPGGRRRIVLTDWDLAAEPPRAEALRIGADGSARRLPVR